jgi:Ca2+-binding EF-hand superfamily protein
LYFFAFTLLLSFHTENITRDEFKQSMAVLGLSLSEAEVDATLRKFDANSSGRLSVTEFANLVAAFNSGKLVI